MQSISPLQHALTSPLCSLPSTPLYAPAAVTQMFSITAWAVPANFGTHESALSTGPPEIPIPPLISANIFKC